MDLLIKDLISLAIGRDEENEARDERSRSSRAQVESGNQDDEDSPPSQWRQQEPSREGWQVSGSRPSRRPHNVNFERNEPYASNQNMWMRKGKENNHDWETVGIKPRRRPLKLCLEEEKGRPDYKAYILPRIRGENPDSETRLLTIQFEWNGVRKAVSSTLVGVSPEFEFALYTLCFIMGGEDNHVQLGPYSVNIKCYRFGDKIGSVFPIAEC